MTAEACRVRIDLSYDGGGFSGWARQPGQRTVQQVLEDALSQVLRADPPVHLTVAGRTDAGVHARGQVAHADLPLAAWLDAAPVIARRLARLLPPDVRVRRIGAAPDGFDARFSALSRRYSYRVCDDVTGPEPLRRHDTLWTRREIEIGPMNEAAALLLGEHDFAAFCRRREGATTVRELLSLSWSRPELRPVRRIRSAQSGRGYRDRGRVLPLDGAGPGGCAPQGGGGGPAAVLAGSGAHRPGP